ncbi:MAG: ferredoxin [Roseburia sp.]|nr:ferredoxin [Roseburia sp.]
MKVNVIEGCISCGLCVSVCPEVFQFNDENVSEVCKQPDETQEEAVREAADGCPVSVIVVEE